MIIMKFGGTSVGDESAMRRLITIVKERLPQKPVVVVSAISQATNVLEQVSFLAEKGALQEAEEILLALKARHLRMACGLIADGALLQNTSAKIAALFAGVADLLHGVYSLRELSARALAQIVVYGELLSSVLVNAVMTQNGINNVLLDARNFIFTDDSYLSGQPNLELIKEKVPQFVAPHQQKGTLVLTQGFIASTKDGSTNTLGREGSDCTATLLGMALKAETIEIWTDVDGMMTADPRHIANTKTIETISFEEAEAMASFGAKVLHPRTVAPAKLANIPVRVLNSKNAAGRGTTILAKVTEHSAVKSVAHKDKIAKINLKIVSCETQDDFADQVTNLCNKMAVNVLLQARTNEELTLLVGDNNKLNDLITALQKIAAVTLQKELALITLVGSNLLKGNLPQRVAALLGEAPVALLTPSASDLSFSFAVASKDLIPVTQKIHDGFFV